MVDKLELALADARYVLEWLQQTKAPSNILDLQWRIVAILKEKANG